MQKVRDSAITALWLYRPEFYNGKITLFRCEPGDRKICDPALVWKPRVSEIEIHVVPGDHSTMIRQPHVRILARDISNWLQQLP